MIAENQIAIDVKGTHFVVPADRAIEIERKARAVKPAPKYRVPRGTRQRPAATVHNTATAEAIDVCGELGLEYWAPSPYPRQVYAVDGAQYFRVHLDHRLVHEVRADSDA